MVAGYHGWLMGGFYPKNYTGTYVFVCGYLAVEFFFIVSGYLWAAKAATYSPAAPQTIYDANLNMIRRKFLRIFAYLYPASILLPCNLAVSELLSAHSVEQPAPHRYGTLERRYARLSGVSLHANVMVFIRYAVCVFPDLPGSVQKAGIFLGVSHFQRTTANIF